MPLPLIYLFYGEINISVADIKFLFVNGSPHLITFRPFRNNRSLTFDIIFYFFNRYETEFYLAIIPPLHALELETGSTFYNNFFQRHGFGIVEVSTFLLKPIKNLQNLMVERINKRISK